MSERLSESGLRYPSERPRASIRAWLPLLFFVSGFSALLYQLIWQRALFAIFGVNIESVTIVVTGFLLGLGLGSLIGGILSEGSGQRSLAVFGLLELSIGGFGWKSLIVFELVGVATIDMPPLARAAACFGVVLVPTLLMGATLPVLVAYSVRESGNVGKSVGSLYSVNTAGSAVAAFAAVFFLMGRLGQSGSLDLAALLNVTVGLVTLLAWVRTSRTGP